MSPIFTRAPLAGLLCLSLLGGCGTTTTTKPAEETASATEPTGEPTSNEDRDGDGWTITNGDCDDEDPEVSPTSPEVACDGVDNDCKDGDLDDGDGDGYACPDAGGGDCDDADASVYPGATDLCYDGVDSDCSANDDNDCDGDGHAVASEGGGDCNDDDPKVHPDAAEQCWNGIDDDCDASTDDCDCDGDGVDGLECGGEDCDDEDSSIHPGAKDVCYDGMDADCGGEDDDDCDGDGYAWTDLGGEDCDDSDPLVNPGEPDVCDDGIDNDCDPDTSDCDCDGDGYDYPECGGEDCDDADASINPGAGDTIADDADSDCDGEVDEDAYCHSYFPLSNGPSARWVYDTLTYDGSRYTETMSIAAWDMATGNAVLHHDFAGGSSFTVDDDLHCDGGGVEQTAVTSDYSLLSGTASYSSPRMLLPAEADLLPGHSWSYSYDANIYGFLPAWSASGTYTVIGADTISVAAGTFDAMVIENDYSVQDELISGYERDGVVVYYYVERLGVVYSYDEDDFGDVWEERELTSYTDLYP